MPIVTFSKDILAQINGDIFGFFLQNIFLDFHLNKQFQNMVNCRYFEISEVVCRICLGTSNWALVKIF